MNIDNLYCEPIYISLVSYIKVNHIAQNVCLIYGVGFGLLTIMFLIIIIIILLWYRTN